MALPDVDTRPSTGHWLVHLLLLQQGLELFHVARRNPLTATITRISISSQDALENRAASPPEPPKTIEAQLHPTLPGHPNNLRIRAEARLAPAVDPPEPFPIPTTCRLLDPVPQRLRANPKLLTHPPQSSRPGQRVTPQIDR